MHHRLAQLSGGEQQRVAIAVALANQPSLLLADEPTGELDSVTAMKIMDIFRKLNQELQITILIVTHDDSIATHVDRVVAIRDGKTSLERIRAVRRQGAGGEREAGVERRPPGPDGRQTDTEEPSHYHEYVVLDSAGRLQIPPEYREKLNIGDRVELDLEDRGILIRPVAGRGWEAKDEDSDED
jgi:AbrB family looped-hinge helix DNA binding protein